MRSGTVSEDSSGCCLVSMVMSVDDGDPGEGEWQQALSCRRGNRRPKPERQCEQGTGSNLRPTIAVLSRSFTIASYTRLYVLRCSPIIRAATTFDDYSLITCSICEPRQDEVRPHIHHNALARSPVETIRKRYIWTSHLNEAS